MGIGCGLQFEFFRARATVSRGDCAELTITLRLADLRQSGRIPGDWQHCAYGTVRLSDSRNFGLITGITETEVQSKENVQDATGDRVKRPARLTLQGQAANPQQRSKR